MSNAHTPTRPTLRPTPQDIRVWLDGRELLPQVTQPPSRPSGAAAEVLVPFGREERWTTLVVGRAAAGAPCIVVNQWRCVLGLWCLAPPLNPPAPHQRGVGGWGLGSLMGSFCACLPQQMLENKPTTKLHVANQNRQLPESYSLLAAIAVPQEALLPGSSPSLLVRTALRLHGWPAPLALLEQVLTQLCGGWA